MCMFMGRLGEADSTIWAKPVPLVVNGDTSRGPGSYQLQTFLDDSSYLSCVPPMLEEAANRGVSDWRPASNGPWKPQVPCTLARRNGLSSPDTMSKLSLRFAESGG